jgi:PBP1b-binding outer membrane lipoprotein LpoB
MKKIIPLIFAAAIIMTGCTHKVETKSQVELAPVEIKPIHITIDINIKVDKELDNFFGDLDK